MGLPGYGWNWQIYDTPENLGETYRGVSNTYYAAKLWMTGGYNFTGDAPPQPMIPIVAYSVFDEAGKVVYAGSAAASTYTVQKGDSLWAIAEKRLGNGTRYNEIKKLNGLTSDVIYAGQVLKLPNR